MFETIRFIARHPLSRGDFRRAMGRYLRWQIATRIQPSPVIIDFVGDVKMIAKRGMTGATGNIYTGLHEFEDMAFILHVLRPDDLFADVGANIGSYTLLASGAAGARSVCFEPDDDARGWLEKNIALNRIEDLVEVRKEAVGAAPGEALFTVGLGTANRAAISSHPTGSERRVVIATLDGVLAGRCPLAIKIDAEGYETAIVDGAGLTLRNPELRCIIMEFNGAGKKFGYDENDLRKRLTEYGFAAYSYLPFERRLATPVSNGTAENVILVRDLTWVQSRLETAPKYATVGKFV